jgi:hypothetical protein
MPRIEYLRMMGIDVWRRRGAGQAVRADGREIGGQAGAAPAAAVRGNGNPAAIVAPVPARDTRVATRQRSAPGPVSAAAAGVAARRARFAVRALKLSPCLLFVDADAVATPAAAARVHRFASDLLQVLADTTVAGTVVAHAEFAWPPRANPSLLAEVETGRQALLSWLDRLLGELSPPLALLAGSAADVAAADAAPSSDAAADVAADAWLRRQTRAGVACWLLRDVEQLASSPQARRALWLELAPVGA